MLTLYSYFRSSAAFRVRIALNLKQVDYQIKPIHLLKNHGEQHSSSYQTINPQQLVPSLVLEDNTVITQSLAIIEYLDQAYPASARLIPQDLMLAARTRQVANIIACDVHPLNNLKILQYLKHELHINDQQKQSWIQNWITQGFEAVENLIDVHSGPFILADQPSLADLCLIPQVYNAKRFNCDLTSFNKIMAVYDYCMRLPEFIAAAPEQQVDFEA